MAKRGVLENEPEACIGRVRPKIMAAAMPTFYQLVHNLGIRWRRRQKND
jgi:hypothetical protein